MPHAEVFLVTPSETSYVNRRDGPVNRRGGHSYQLLVRMLVRTEAQNNTSDGQKDNRVKYLRPIHNRPHQRRTRLHS